MTSDAPRSREPGTTGDLADVMSFSRCGRTTVFRAMKGSPPALSHCKFGKVLMFPEEAVIAWCADVCKWPAGVRTRSEALEFFRREWRAHLNVRRADVMSSTLDEVKRRLADLERLFTAQTAKEAA